MKYWNMLTGPTVWVLRPGKLERAKEFEFAVYISKIVLYYILFIYLLIVNIITSSSQVFKHLYV